MTARARSAAARRPIDAPAQAQRVDPISAAAAAAFEVAAARISALSRETGRPGVIVGLRREAQDLSRSAVAQDQVLASGLGAAADDLTWGRPPMDGWLRRLTDPAAVTAADRAAVASDPLGAGRDIATAAAAAAREIETRLLARGPAALTAARRHPDRLEAAAALQLAVSNDPRLNVTPALRAVLRESAFALARKGAPQGGPPWRRPSWRRLRLWRTWIGGEARDGERRRREV